jgi:hypothetical protein
MPEETVMGKWIILLTSYFAPYPFEKENFPLSLLCYLARLWRFFTADTCHNVLKNTLGVCFWHDNRKIWLLTNRVLI